MTILFLKSRLLAKDEDWKRLMPHLRKYLADSRTLSAVHAAALLREANPVVRESRFPEALAYVYRLCRVRITFNQPNAFTCTVFLDYN